MTKNECASQLSELKAAKLGDHTWSGTSRKLCFPAISLLLILFVGCAPLPKIKFDETFIGTFPQDSKAFAEKYKAVVKEFQPEKESLGNIEVETDGLSASFGDDKTKTFQLRFLKVSKPGKVLVGSTDLIGKNKKQILEIFGEPKYKSEDGIGFEDSKAWVFLNFSFVSGKVSDWTLGYEP